MKRSIRRLTALFALLALSFSVVEKGWSAACDAGMAVSSSGVSEASASHGEHLPGPVGDQEGDAGRGSTSCPMTVASGMACGVATLIAPAASPLTTFDTSNAVLPGSDLPVGSGALSSLFRPPQQ